MKSNLTIWLINNYNMLPEHGALNRNYYLAKYLSKSGQSPIVFAGSHPHNTSLQLITDSSRYKIYQTFPFPWVLNRTRNYEKNRFSRVVSMFEFYFNMLFSADEFDKPDAIVGSSAHPLAALLAIKLGKRYNAKKIVEIRDLWPESIVAYGLAKRNNPVIKLLYLFERYLYKNADEIVLTMENGYLYFEEQKLTKLIPREKVHYINNGVDLELFNENKRKYVFHDENLEDDKLFKVVYTGSIRKVNNLGLLLDVAKSVKAKDVVFLIWGAGDELDQLCKRVHYEKINNVIFKGPVEKKYIPYITSRADLNIMHNWPTPITKYGLSANKLFDYAAAGKPILTDFPCGMNPATVYGAGVSIDSGNCQDIASAIDYFARLDRNGEEYSLYCQNAKKLANDYSFERLSKKLLSLIQ